jgi:hypothetical protein
MWFRSTSSSSISAAGGHLYHIRRAIGRPEKVSPRAAGKFLMQKKNDSAIISSVFGKEDGILAKGF